MPLLFLIQRFFISQGLTPRSNCSTNSKVGYSPSPIQIASKSFFIAYFGFNETCGPPANKNIVGNLFLINLAILLIFSNSL